MSKIILQLMALAATAETPVEFTPIDLSGFTEVIYVASDGDDSNPGTEELPKATIQAGINAAPASGGAVKVGPGAFVTGGTAYYSGRYAALMVLQKDLTIIGEPGQTSVTSTLATGSYNVFVGAFSTDTLKTATWYHFIFDLGTRAWSATMGDVGGVYNTPTMQVFYNCAFIGLNTLNIIYNNGGGAVVNNCSFILGGYFNYSNRETLHYYFTNCAFGGVHNVTTYDTTCLSSATFDVDFNITSGTWINAGTGTDRNGSVADLGVYGGQYAW